ncbi:MAG: LPS export ABC transporter permease LptF [Pelagibacteraceae bacterium]|nr:LPS export ABC transporter permease LptF [Pelagibacteraceae bacterium]
MGKIISHYLFKETATTWLAVTVILLIILVANKFSDVLGDAAIGLLSSDSIMGLMFYSSIDYLIVLIPLSTFLSILLVFGRLYSNSEITAISSSGIGPIALYRPLILPTLVLAILLAIISGYISPQARKNIETTKLDSMTSVDIEFLEPGRFVNLKNGSVFYSEDLIEENRLINVFLQQENKGRVNVVVAEYAEVENIGDNNNLLIFYNGKRYEGRPGDQDFRIMEFSEHQLPLFNNKQKANKVDLNLENIDFLYNQNTLQAYAEIQWRFSPSIALIILVLLSIPLSKVSPRQGQYGGIIFGVLIYMIYVNLLGAAKVWFEQGDTPPILGLWWVHLIWLLFASIAILSSYNFFQRLSIFGEKN